LDCTVRHLAQEIYTPDEVEPDQTYTTNLIWSNDLKLIDKEDA
jgi:hypothetical protein